MRRGPAAIPLMLLLTCCATRTGREVASGRLRCVQYTIPRWRQYTSNVEWRVFFNGARILEGRSTTSCHASPDVAAEILALDRQAVRVDHDQAILSDLAGNPSYAAWGCAGRCLLFEKGIDHLDTGRFAPYPQPLHTQPLALSPDGRTLITSGPAVSPDGPTSTTFCVRDLATGTAVQWTVSLEQFPWLAHCERFTEDSAECLARRGAGFEWRTESGRDVLVLRPSFAVITSQPSCWDRCGFERPMR